MANLLYRVSTNAAVPVSTSAKGTPLTNAEIDGNFKSINDDLANKAVLPTQTANSGKYLTTNGTATSWNPISEGATISEDLATNVDYFPLWSKTITGVPTTVYTSSTKLYFNPSTGALNATAFNSLSDKNLKDNVSVIQNATETVASISGVEFTWKDNGQKSAGVIAQDIEQILPFIVSTSTSGVKSVNYHAIIAYLIEANKELSKRITTLEATINT